MVLFIMQPVTKPIGFVEQNKQSNFSTKHCLASVNNNAGTIIAINDITAVSNSVSSEIVVVDIASSSIVVETVVDDLESTSKFIRPSTVFISRWWALQ